MQDTAIRVQIHAAVCVTKVASFIAETSGFLMCTNEAPMLIIRSTIEKTLKARADRILSLGALFNALIGMVNKVFERPFTTSVPIMQHIMMNVRAVMPNAIVNGRFALQRSVDMVAESWFVGSLQVVRRCKLYVFV